MGVVADSEVEQPAISRCRPGAWGSSCGAMTVAMAQEAAATGVVESAVPSVTGVSVAPLSCRKGMAALLVSR